MNWGDCTSLCCTLTSDTSDGELDAVHTTGTQLKGFCDREAKPDSEGNESVATVWPEVELWIVGETVVTGVTGWTICGADGVELVWLCCNCWWVTVCVCKLELIIWEVCWLTVLSLDCVVFTIGVNGFAVDCCGVAVVMHWLWVNCVPVWTVFETLLICWDEVRDLALVSVLISLLSDEEPVNKDCEEIAELECCQWKVLIR